MAETPPVPRSNSSTSSFDNASNLIGEVRADGTASLHKDLFSVNGLTAHPVGSTDGSREGSFATSDEESGDGLAPDPSNVIEGGRGGGVKSGSLQQHRSNLLGPLRVNTGSTDGAHGPQEQSIPVKLKKTGEAGRYLLTADDPELREILRHNIEREAGGGIRRKRFKFSDIVFTRQFTAFDRQNPATAASPFHGFFTLFWMGIALMLVKVAANNWRTYGSIFGRNEILHLMFRRDVFILGVSDGVLCGSTFFCLGLQKLVHTGYLSWNGSGWIIQNVWQTFYLAAVITWTWYRDWPWTHSVFIVLHTITMLMKQHSYAFYNGHLSEVYRRRKYLENKLQQLRDLEPNSPSAVSPGPTAFASSYFEQHDLNNLHQRRKSAQVNLKDGSLNMEKDISSVASAIEADKPLDFDQIRSLRRLMSWEIASLTEELKGRCTVTKNFYPRNLTLRDFFGYLPLPTLVYELEYPRQEKINWNYVLEKTAATFGVIGVMIVVSQAYIYPSVIYVLRMKESGIPLKERLQEFPWVLGDLLFPFMMEYLLSWYVIWECVLNVLAELTLFADRGFYADWWNSVTWADFARDWNRPVHNFLLRFAYHSSISAFKLSRSTATLVTFFLSACVHELLMAVLFKKVRGYLLAMQMLQLPLVMLSRTKFLKGRDTLGNMIFWLGIFIGPSFLCSLYLFL